MLVVLQSNDFERVTTSLVNVALMDFPVWTYGQIGQCWLHLCMPGISLFGLELAGGTFALISLSLIVWGLVYAIKGGWGKTLARYGSATMVLQCLLVIWVTLGSLLAPVKSHHKHWSLGGLWPLHSFQGFKVRNGFVSGDCSNNTWFIISVYQHLTVIHL